MKQPHRMALLVAIAFTVVMGHGLGAQPTPGEELVIAWHVTLAPVWFDPAQAPLQITPFGLLYALHDALVRPLPGEPMEPSLAESWTEGPDGLIYEFTLRPGSRFHNGDPARREALLHRIQQLTVERAMCAPVMDLRGLHGVGPRIAEHTINVIPLLPISVARGRAAEGAVRRC